MCRSFSVAFAVVLLATGFTASIASAAPLQAGDRLLVDWCAVYTGENNVDSLGRTWNSLIPQPGKTTAKLSDTAGNLTDHDIYASSSVGYSQTGASFPPSTLAASSLNDYPDFAFKDGIQNAASHPMTLTIQHLDTSLTYNLTFYGSYGVSANDYLTEVTINDDASGKQSYNAGGAAGEGSVTFTNVAPDINGKIKIVLRATHATNRGYNNVLDIQAVPEPGTSALLGLAGLAALRRRITH